MRGPIEMATEECVARLRDGRLGRVAVATPAGPRIVPVVYVVHDDAIVFASPPYSELGTYGVNSQLAFEIDEVDVAAGTGWTVVAVGRCETLDEDEAAQVRDGLAASPWAGGRRNLYLRLRWQDVTGRAVR